MDRSTQTSPRADALNRNGTESQAFEAENSDRGAVSPFASDGKETPNRHEQIALRAYEIYQTRGGQHGYHVQDWVVAERSLDVPSEGERGEEKETPRLKPVEDAAGRTTRRAATTTAKAFGFKRNRC